jgi:hypothetical protein
MAQLAKQSSNPFFTVESTPSYVQMPDGTFAPDGFTINRRTDTMQVLGKVTERYGIIQNSDLINAAEDAFRAKGMTDYKRNIIVTGDGEKMYATYDFRNHTRKLKVGDEVGLRLTMKNSFDGVVRAAFDLGMLRLVCSNGMTTLEREVAMTKKHSSGVNVDFMADALEKAILNWDNSTEVFNRLSDVSLTQEQGRNILARFEEDKTLSGKLRESIELIWNSPTHQEDSARNMFNLYNAVTQHLTHDVAPSRFELANRVSANVLKTLDRASRTSSFFDKLVKPVQLPAVALN